MIFVLFCCPAPVLVIDASMPTIVSLYSTFSPFSTSRSGHQEIVRVELTTLDERLEEWKEDDDDVRSEISKEDVLVTTALISPDSDESDDAIGRPEKTSSSFWPFSARNKRDEVDPDDIAIQVCVSLPKGEWETTKTTTAQRIRRPRPRRVVPPPPRLGKPAPVRPVGAVDLARGTRAHPQDRLDNHARRVPDVLRARDGPGEHPAGRGG
jgi:hypothetical protein